jgi:hypothetical protein
MFKRKIFNPQTLVQEYTTTLHANKMVSSTDERTPEQQALWAIAMCEARQMMDGHSTRDMASALIDGIQPLNIRDWLFNLYQDLIYEKMGSISDESVDLFFNTVTEIDQDVAIEMDIGDAIGMMLDAIRR